MYQATALPWIYPTATLTNPVASQEETSVTAEQYACLADCFCELAPGDSTCVVEVGAFRGVTTEFFSQHCERAIYAVDPFVGYGGSEDDLAVFRQRIVKLPRVTHLREPSGDAAGRWGDKPLIGLLFIDAIHDFVSTRFDLKAWQRHLAPGGFVALHDVDQLCFAGTRRAAFEAARRFRLFRHVPNLAIFQL